MSNLEAFTAIAVLVTTLLGQGYLLDRRSAGRIDRMEDHMNTRFAAADAKLDALDGKFERRFELIDRRFEQVDQRFEQVDQRFEQVERRFEQVDRRFDQVNQQIFALASGLKPLVEQAERHESA